MQLHFETLGRGDPLIILHGLFGSFGNWLTVAKRLADTFRVFLVDQRNHGHSPHSREMDYPLMAGDLREFLARQGLARASLIGHSMGGKAAMEFALQSPECVDKLIVVDIAPRAYSPRHEQILGALLALDPSAFQTRQQMESALAPAIPSLALRQFLLKNIERDAADAFRWRMNLPGIAANYGRLGAALAPGRVCDRPALFLRGGASDYLLPEDFALIRHLFPRAEFQALAGARHWVHVEAPEAFLTAVRDFLANSDCVFDR